MSVLRCCCNTEECDQYHTCITGNQYPNPQLQSVATSGGSQPFYCCGDTPQISRAMNAFTVGVNTVSVVGAKYIGPSGTLSEAGHQGNSWLVLVEIDYTLALSCEISDTIVWACPDQISGTSQAYAVLRFGCAQVGYPNTFICTGSYGHAYYNAPSGPNYFAAQVLHSKGLATVPTGPPFSGLNAINCVTSTTTIRLRVDFEPLKFSTSNPDPGCPSVFGFREQNSSLGLPLSTAFNQRVNVPASAADPCQPFAQNLFYVVGFAAHLEGIWPPILDEPDCFCDRSSAVGGSYPYWSNVFMLETEWSLL